MSTLDMQLAALAAVPSAQLRERWEHLYGASPPPGFGPDLIARGIAYTIQEKVRGTLPPSISREIRRGVVEIATAALSPERAPSLRSGTRLAREWHGRTYYVDVVEGGFDYSERRYRSLTAIAREITGAAWSGPRFFGLTAPRTSHA